MIVIIITTSRISTIIVVSSSDFWYHHYSVVLLVFTVVVSNITELGSNVFSPVSSRLGVVQEADVKASAIAQLVSAFSTGYAFFPSEFPKFWLLSKNDPRAQHFPQKVVFRYFIWILGAL